MMRLDKMLAYLKYGSRSEIKKMAKDGKILVNGIVMPSADRSVNPLKDVVTLDGIPVFYKDVVHLMMNKPIGLVCAATDLRYPTVIELLKEPYSRFDMSICGRLDIDTDGLIILTTDGEYLHKVISPKNEIFKTYYVTLKSPLKDYKILEKGIQILDGLDKPYITAPAKIFDVELHTCRIAISEGKFHQVKRMFEAIGNEVVTLRREKIGKLSLDPTLPAGGYRELTAEEVAMVLEN